MQKIGESHQGKGFIFSRWYDNLEPRELRVADTRIPADGWVEAGDYEGNFVSVRGRYPWEPGVYRMEVRGAETDDVGRWFEFWVVDDRTGIETWIGSLRFKTASDGSTSISNRCGMALEAYGGGGYLTPREIPYWQVSSKPPTIDGEAATSVNPCYPGNVGSLRNAGVSYDEDAGVGRFEIGLDHLTHELDPETIC